MQQMYHNFHLQLKLHHLFVKLFENYKFKQTNKQTNKTIPNFQSNFKQQPHFNSDWVAKFTIWIKIN